MRELRWRASALRMEAWYHTAQITAMVFNAFRSGGSARGIDDFHPMLKATEDAEEQDFFERLQEMTAGRKHLTEDEKRAIWKRARNADTGRD